MAQYLKYVFEYSFPFHLSFALSFFFVPVEFINHPNVIQIQIFLIQIITMIVMNTPEVFTYDEKRAKHKRKKVKHQSIAICSDSME